MLSLAIIAAMSAAPVQLIIDTDLGFDIDDVGAIAVAHALADQGKVDVVGIVCNTGRDACIVGVDIVNTYYGRGNISIGSYKGSFGSYTDNGQDSHYVNELKSRFPHRVNSRDDVPSGLEVYRNALLQAANNSITIASIGETTNLQDLLREEYDLVRAKVKRIVYMDGGFNFGCAAGAYGPADECWKSAQYVVANMPSPDVEQIFQLHGDPHNGWWVGNDPKCGMDSNNPVKVAYQYGCSHMWQGACDNYGRDSWDPNTVYVAIMGSVGGGQCAIGSGVPCAYSVSDDGGTEYRDYDDHSKNMYDFRLIGDWSSVGNTIEELLCQPVGPSPSPPPSPPWTKAAGKNCWGSRGGQPAHGAEDLESPPDASCGVMSIAQCEAKCEQLAGCTGITVQPASGGYNCYRKANIHLDQCDSGTNFDTYLKPMGQIESTEEAWKEHEGSILVRKLAPPP